MSAAVAQLARLVEDLDRRPVIHPDHARHIVRQLWEQTLPELWREIAAVPNRPGNLDHALECVEAELLDLLAELERTPDNVLPDEGEWP